MPQPITQVDAFTTTPFAGNPAAVCVLTEPRDEVWMQHVAREMNLAETAFLRPRSDGFDLRWFTPTVEIDRVAMPRSQAPMSCGKPNSSL
jgi:PhzF family phenazine biosynthesis protein